MRAKNLLIFLIVLVLLPFASAFTFEGYTYNLTKGAISGTNVTVDVYNFTGQGPTLIASYSALSTANGSFSVNVVDETGQGYKPTVRKYDGSGNAEYIGQSLPDFPFQEMSNLGSIDFYLKPGATINLTAIGAADWREDMVEESPEAFPSDITYYASLEWDSTDSTWGFLNGTTMGVKNLVKTYGDFTVNESHNLLTIMPTAMAAFHKGSDLWCFVNTTHFVNWTEGDMLPNATIDLTARAYNQVFDIYYDTSNQHYYILNQNATSDFKVDEFNEAFTLQASYAIEAGGPTTIEKINGEWYAIYGGSEFNITEVNDDFTRASYEELSFSSIGIFGIATNETGWYYANRPGNNVTEFSIETETKSFQYMVKDQRLGYPIAEHFDSNVEQATIYLPADRNYSIMLYPNMAFPVSYDLDFATADDDYKTTLSSPTRVELQFNTTEQWKRVSGYVDLEGAASFTDLNVIAFLLEPGNMLFKDYPLPMNLSAWTETMWNDEIDESTGFYNITLPGATMGASMVLFFTAEKNGDHYGFFKNITLSYGSADVTEFNATLHPLAGSESNLSVEKASDEGPESINITTKQVAFKIQNSTGDTPQNAFVEMELNHNNTPFSWTIDVQQSDAGIFRAPVLNATVKRINVYSADFAPQKTTKTAEDMNTQPTIISMTNFDPGAIDSGDEILMDIFMDLMKSNADCDVPNPNTTECSLMPSGNVSKEEFSPLTAVMGGGKISFRMEDMNNDIVIHYVNVDLLASGPPDIMFDADSNDTANGSSLEQAWRFGSNGPEIYDAVIVGIPYNETEVDETAQQSILIKTLFDETWDQLWNSTTNPNGLDISAFPDYADFDSDWFNASVGEQGGMTCVDYSSFDLSVQGCYVDASDDMIWMVIPHFSGLGPQIASHANLGTIASDKTIYSCYPNCTAYVNLTMTNPALEGIHNLTLWNQHTGTDDITYALTYWNGTVWTNDTANVNSTTILDYNLTLGVHRYKVDVAMGSPQNSKWNFTIELDDSNYSLDPWLDSISLTTPADDGTVGSSADFSFQLYSTNYSTQNCTLFVDGTAQGNNDSVSNNTLTTISATGLTAGNYDWWVYCNGTGNSTTRNVSVDASRPAVTNARTNASGVISGSSSITVNVTATDGTNITSVTVNGTSMTNYTASDYNLTTTATTLGCSGMGLCTLQFNATDYWGNFNSSVTLNLNVDDYAPTVTVNSINTSASTTNVTSTTTFRIVVNATDIGNAGTTNVTLNNGSIVQLTHLGSNIWEANTTATATGCSGEGACVLYINATDDAGQSNTSVTTTIYVDDTAPTVTTLSASVSEVTSTTAFQFNATVTDTSTLGAVTVNGSVLSSLTGDIYSNSTVTPATLDCAANAVCTLGVSAYDAPGNVNNTEVTTITVDDLAPAVTFVYNSTNLTASTSSITLNITVVEANTISAVVANNASMTQISATTTWYLTDTPASFGCGTTGTCTITFVANDTAGNSNNSVTTTISVDDSAPVVTGGSVTNATKAKNATVVNVQVTATDSVAGISTVKVNDQTMYLLSGTTYHANLSGQTMGCGPEGTCTLTFNVTDSLGNENATTTTTYTIDTTAPTNTTAFSASTSSSGATVSATFGEAVKCTVEYGNNVSNMSSEANSSSFATTGAIAITGLSSSTVYYYNVTQCWDEAGNIDTTEYGPFNFTTSAPATSSGGGGGGGSSGGYTTTSTVDLGDLTGAETSLDLGKGDSVTFTHESTTQSVKINDVGSSYADLTIAEDTAVRLYVGQSKDVDVDGDSKADVNVKLESLESGEASVKITSLSEREGIAVAPPGTYDRTPVVNDTEEGAAEESVDAELMTGDAVADSSAKTEEVVETVETTEDSVEGDKDLAWIMSVLVIVAGIIAVIALFVMRARKHHGLRPPNL